MWSHSKSKNCRLSSGKTWKISWKRIHAVRPHSCVQNLAWLAASGLPISGLSCSEAPAAWARRRVMPRRIQPALHGTAHFSKRFRARLGYEAGDPNEGSIHAWRSRPLWPGCARSEEECEVVRARFGFAERIRIRKRRGRWKRLRHDRVV